MIDVGAHKGQFALYARELLPTADIYCFEPLSGPRLILSRLFAGDSKVHVYGLALGGSESVGDMFVSRRNDSSSLLPISAEQVSRFPGTDVAGVQATPIRRLDAVLHERSLRSPILLKIDVQGFELEVLKGSTELLGSCSQVLVECSFVHLYEGQPLFEQVHQYLRDVGFTLCAASCSARDSSGRWVQGDFLFDSVRIPTT